MKSMPVEQQRTTNWKKSSIAAMMKMTTLTTYTSMMGRNVQIPNAPSLPAGRNTLQPTGQIIWMTTWWQMSWQWWPLDQTTFILWMSWLPWQLQWLCTASTLRLRGHHTRELKGWQLPLHHLKNQKCWTSWSNLPWVKNINLEGGPQRRGSSSEFCVWLRAVTYYLRMKLWPLGKSKILW